MLFGMEARALPSLGVLPNNGPRCDVQQYLLEALASLGETLPAGLAL